MEEKVLSKPLDIGASDLMRAVSFTYSGTLHVQVKKLLSKIKWQPRYVVLSQGCLYIYEEKNSKRAENAYTLKQFESVKELEDDGDESYCFCIKPETPTKKPVVFACDKDETRQAWVEELDKVLHEIQNCSVDSGFGSGGTFPKRASGNGSLGRFPVRGRENGGGGAVSGRDIGRSMGPLSQEGSRFQSGSNFSPRNSEFADEEFLKIKSILYEAEQKGYEEISYVSSSNVMPGPVQESLINSSANTFQVRDGPAETSLTREESKRQSPEDLYVNTDQGTSFATSMTEPKQIHEDMYVNATELATAHAEEETLPKESYVSVRGADSIAASSTASFLCVTGRAETVDDTELGGERERAGDCTGDNASKTEYESPEEDGIYENTELYDEVDYFCKNKKQIKSNLHAKPSGTFLVCPGETTRLDLRVKTRTGDISFRIHEKDGKMSLYKDFSVSKYVFPTLDALLRYYHIYEVPSRNANVKLTKGYNCQP